MIDGDLVPHRGGIIPEKIHRQHRERLAIVYIRQSTVQQVERHQESTRLQYALVDRAIQFGWPRETIVVIDDDLGRSGSTIEGRLGFQRLVAEVGLGNVGLVLGVEMSRLARSCRDWHQLLEICALFDTLIADVDGVYDPSSYNDRLLLGLKGTMSEAELHILKARMLEGRKAKARRGELSKAVPMGYLRRPSGEVVLDPDEQAQATIRLVFDLFDRLRTIGKVLRYLVEHDIRLPVRARGRVRKDELEWHRPNRPTLQNLFANPTYAGAYVYGVRSTDRRRQKAGRAGTGRRSLRAEEAEVFLPDRMPAYITWDRYQRNQAQLQSNRAAWGGAPRAGSALLSGVINCGRCGMRMTAQYNNNGHAARYVCMSMKSNYGEPFCQSLTAAPLDALMTRLVLRALEPAALEASLALAADLEAERAALDVHWQQRLERARYEVERARRQYNACEPENRLVARSLERAWEEALAEQMHLEADYERVRREQLAEPSAAELSAIRSLAQDLPALWRAETTTQEERQTIIRLLLVRVLVEVIHDTEQVRVICHWHGGNRTLHQLMRPVARLTTLSTYSRLVARAADLRRDGHNFAEIADTLNREGWRPAKRRDTFSAPMVHHLLIRAGVIEPKYRRRKPHIERQPDEWTTRELAEQIGVPEPTLYTWIQKGRLRSRFVRAGSGRAKLVYADAETIAALKAIRARPAPWRRLPPPFTEPINPTTES
ncbi:recombinase family protein [Bradyrhizobium sp. Ec3.3]|uniref:recombinase family protein n=2 Tax=Bradyrhizobium sp. Ec3.3 TaxID=189753 RepID=UPI0004012EF4|nr:recombinase family protein [Bradyrhizobium sp. Ec3.3]